MLTQKFLDIEDENGWAFASDFEALWPAELLVICSKFCGLEILKRLSKRPKRTYIRPILESGTTPFSPFEKKDIYLLESVPNNFAHKVVMHCSGLSYEVHSKWCPNLLLAWLAYDYPKINPSREGAVLQWQLRPALHEKIPRLWAHLIATVSFGSSLSITTSSGKRMIDKTPRAPPISTSDKDGSRSHYGISCYSCFSFTTSSTRLDLSKLRFSCEEQRWGRFCLIGLFQSTTKPLAMKYWAFSSSILKPRSRSWRMRRFVCCYFFLLWWCWCFCAVVVLSVST